MHRHMALVPLLLVLELLAAAEHRVREALYARRHRDVSDERRPARELGRLRPLRAD